MKRYFLIILIALTLTSCGSNEQTNRDSETATQAEETTTTTIATTKTPTTTTVTTTTTAVTTTEIPTTTTETTTTSITTTTTTETTTETTTTAPETTTTVRTFNTEWYRRDFILYPECHVDKYVYAAPTRESEQIGFVEAGGIVVNIGYANEEWIVIEWNDGIGFMEVYEVYENPTPTETTATMP